MSDVVVEIDLSFDGAGSNGSSGVTIATMRWWLILLVGCGRFSFDPLAEPVIDAGEDASLDALADAAVNPNRVVEVATGGFHTCVRLAGGSVWCWGDNGDGQLGDGTTVSRLAPRAVPGITDALELEAGTLHTCVRRTVGSPGTELEFAL